MLTKEEYAVITNYEIKLLKDDLYNYIKYIQIIPMFKKMINGMEVPDAPSQFKETTGKGIDGDSIGEDFAIKRSDLNDRIHSMQCTVERIEQGLSILTYEEREIIQKKFFEHRSYAKVASDLNRSESGLKYRVNKICKKMIRK